MYYASLQHQKKWYIQQHFDNPTTFGKKIQKNFWTQTSFLSLPSVQYSANKPNANN